MALEAYSQFHAFDWSNNLEWLAYKEKLEVPTEGPDALLSIRQKWFKRTQVCHSRIFHLLSGPQLKEDDAMCPCFSPDLCFSFLTSLQNPEFDPSFSPASSKSENSTSTKTTSETAPKMDSAPQQPASGGPRNTFTVGRMFLLIMNVLVLSHGVLVFVNLFSPVLLGPAHLVFAYLHSLLSYGFLLFQAVGRPQFNIQWLHTAVNNESMHYIMYCMMFMAQAPRPSTFHLHPSFPGCTSAPAFLKSMLTHPPPKVALLPVLIYALINVSILLPRFLTSIGMPVEPVASFSSLVKENKPRLLLSASNIELAVLLSLLVDIFSGDLSTVLPCILYFNFLGSRMQVSSWTRATVHRIEAAADSVLLSQSMPSIVQAVYRQAKALIVKLAMPNFRPIAQQQQQQQ